MIANDILRRLRYALELNDDTVGQLITSVQKPSVPPPTPEELNTWYLKEEDPGFQPMPPKMLLAFLDGLILRCRGPRDTDSVTPTPTLNNNMVLKKIRIALSLQEQDLLEILRMAGILVSKNELTALFRKPGQRNYVECLDQFLRNFLAGLALYQQAGKLQNWPPAGLIQSGPANPNPSL